MPGQTKLVEMRPASIRLPASLGLKRRVGPPPPHLTPARLAQWQPKHDDYTMIHDVFHSPKDGGLIAMGPNPSSIGENGLSLRSVRVNGEACDVKTAKLGDPPGDISLVKIRIAAPAAAQYKVEFDWGVFNAGVEVAPRDGEEEDNRFTLQALQKDSEPEWIVDWCRFYHRVHGVERVLLYDNGSANRDEIARAIRDLGEPIEVVLIDWPFPFGAHSYDLYSTLGALNHGAARFAGPRSVFLAADIDDYVYADRYALKDVLSYFSRRPLHRLLWSVKQHRRRRHIPDLRLTMSSPAAPARTQAHAAALPPSSSKPRKPPPYFARLSRKIRRLLEEVRPVSHLLMCGYYRFANRLPDDFAGRTPRYSDFVWRSPDKTLNSGRNLYIPSRTHYITLHHVVPKPGYGKLTTDVSYFPVYEYFGLGKPWKSANRYKPSEETGLVRDTTILDACPPDDA